MKVDLIKNHIASLTNKLAKNAPFKQHFASDALEYFSLHWDIEALDFYNMFDKAIESKISRRLWNKEDWFPKKVMLEFIETDKEFVRSMFRDLFNEQKDLNMRCSRFLLHCDELLAVKQRKDKAIIEHYHSNYQMIFLYLHLHNPEKYCLYDYDLFIRFLKSVSSRQIPVIHDPEQFVKMCNVFMRFLSKDDPFMKESISALKRNGFQEVPLSYWIPNLLKESNVKH